VLAFDISAAGSYFSVVTGVALAAVETAAVAVVYVLCVVVAAAVAAELFVAVEMVDMFGVVADSVAVVQMLGWFVSGNCTGGVARQSGCCPSSCCCGVSFLQQSGSFHFEKAYPQQKWWRNVSSCQETSAFACDSC